MDKLRHDWDKQFPEDDPETDFDAKEEARRQIFVKYAKELEEVWGSGINDVVESTTDV